MQEQGTPESEGNAEGLAFLVQTDFSQWADASIPLRHRYCKPMDQVHSLAGEIVQVHQDSYEPDWPNSHQRVLMVVGRVKVADAYHGFISDS